MPRADIKTVRNKVGWISVWIEIGIKWNKIKLRKFTRWHKQENKFRIKGEMSVEIGEEAQKEQRNTIQNKSKMQ